MTLLMRTFLTTHSNQLGDLRESDNLRYSVELLYLQYRKVGIDCRSRCRLLKGTRRLQSIFNIREVKTMAYGRVLRILILMGSCVKAVRKERMYNLDDDGFCNNVRHLELSERALILEVFGSDYYSKILNGMNRPFSLDKISRLSTAIQDKNVSSSPNHA